MQIKIWGTRGDYPVSGSQYVKYGANTICVEIQLANGHSLLLDAGTGLIAYDKQTPLAKKSHVLCFTHLHYDHIQGLPFFSGIFNKKFPLVMLVPANNGNKDFKAGLKQIFNGIHTPFSWENLPGHEIRTVSPNDQFELFGASLATCPTLYPGGCLAWKITADGWTFAYTGNHEIPLDKSDSKKNLWNERLMGFLAGSDIVLADAHFSREDHELHPGLGHSNPQQWQRDLADRHIGKLYFIHFNPNYDDKKINDLMLEVKDGPIPANAVFDGAILSKNGLENNCETLSCPSCEFSRKVAAFSDTHSIVDTLLTTARNLSQAEGGSVYLVAREELNFAAAQNDVLFPNSAANKFAYFNSHLPLDKSSIAGYVAKTGEILNIDNVYELPVDCEYSFNSDLDTSTGYRTYSVLAVPLKNGHGKIIGVLQLINSRGFSGYRPFTDKMAAEISNLAQMATIPLERSFLVVAMILRILKTAALRDPAETTGHVQRVGSIAAELYHYWAEKHNTDPEELLFTKGQLRLAAMLHDVGKVGVPDAVLNKAGRLTDQERRIMERHSYLGAGLFGNSDHEIDQMAKDIALHHHARWDGNGYTGKQDIESPGGREIPIWARITAIADVYDALVSPRPYRKVWTSREAVAFLRQESGKQFDPELVDDFRKILGIVNTIFERFPDEEQ